MATSVTDPSLDPTSPAPGGTNHRGEPPDPASEATAGTVAVQRRRSKRSDFTDMMFGRKLRTDQEMHERLDNPTALAVFASDALSSVAYATEEMLTVLLIGGAGLLPFGTLVPLTLGIAALLVIRAFSHPQTIKPYPSRGRA